jgi:hypothetical protein
MSRQPLGPTQFLMQGVLRVLLLQIECESDHAPKRSAEVKNTYVFRHIMIITIHMQHVNICVITDVTYWSG